MPISLFFQPVQTTADIDYSLASRVERTSDVGGYGIVGALNLSRPANIVVGQAEPQYGNPQPVQNSAQRCVGHRVGVPVGHQHHGTLALCRKPAGIDTIVFRMWSFDGRTEAQKFCELPQNLLLQLSIRSFPRTEYL